MGTHEILQEAKLFFASGQLDESVRLFSEAEKQGCDSIDVFLSRGAALMALGKYIEASHDFSRVIERERSHERAHYFRGVARVAQGRYEEAVEDLTVSLAQNNVRGIAHLIRGIAFTEMGRKEDAVLDINTASAFSDAELNSFKKLFGEKASPFMQTKAMLAEESAPWNNLLSKESAKKLRRLIQ